LKLIVDRLKQTDEAMGRVTKESSRKFNTGLNEVGATFLEIGKGRP
jgi:hypothetical protein